MTFDLEKAREAIEEAVDRLSQKIGDEDGPIWEKEPEKAAVLQTLLDEIAHLEKWMIKNRDAATELQYQLDDAVKENERLRADYDKLKSSLLVIDGRKKLMNQAARIDELEADNQNLVTLNKSLMNNDWILRDNNRKYRKRAQKAELLNKELKSKIGPDADAKPREGLYGKYRISKADGSPVDPNADYFVLRLDTDPVARRAAREYSYVTPDRDLARGLQDRLAKYDPQLKDCMNIQFFGLEKPHCWQITEERKAAIKELSELLTAIGCPSCHYYIQKNYGEDITVLRAMLTEADHDKP